MRLFLRLCHLFFSDIGSVPWDVLKVFFACQKMHVWEILGLIFKACVLETVFHIHANCVHLLLNFRTGGKDIFEASLLYHIASLHFYLYIRSAEGFRIANLCDIFLLLRSNSPVYEFFMTQNVEKGGGNL